MDLLHEAFKGKRIVLAGMGKGQGTVTAKLLLSFGAEVYALSRSGRSIEPGDENFHSIKVDLENRDNLQTAINEHLEGVQLYGLVNNTGTWEMPASKLVPPGDMERFVKMNLMTQYNALYFLTRNMKKGGSIVNIGASRALFKNNGSGYTISKYAIEEFTRIAASELKSKDIRVNCLQPGSVSKEDSFDLTYPFNFPKEAAMNPLKIAYASMFLLSPLSTGINGVSIPIDDGMEL